MKLRKIRNRRRSENALFNVRLGNFLNGLGDRVFKYLTTEIPQLKEIKDENPTATQSPS